MSFQSISGQDRVKMILQNAVKNDRVANAYLFVGGSAFSRKEVARAFGRELNCKPQDLVWLSKQEDKSQILIDQIRELIQLVRYGPSIGQYLLVVVEDADKMTDEAGTAFLKSLEEPAAGVVFVLTAEKEKAVLATIRSRCQKLVFAEDDGRFMEEPDFVWLYQEFDSIAQKAVVERLKLAEKLSREKEEIEDRLSSLIKWSHYVKNDPAATRQFMEALASIRKKANSRLALEVMCLNLGEKWKNKN